MIRGTWTVAKRELRGYFDQPTAYVLAVAFLGLSLFLLFRSMYSSNVASLRPLFDLLPMLFAVFIPAVTMRSLAEERRGKTLEWLMAQPLDEGQIVLGKFLGDWLFVLITLGGTVPTAIGVLLVSDADAGIVVAQYVGASLLALELVALGLWASSFTRNQIMAFIVAAALSFGLYLIGLPIVQIGVPSLFAGPLARLSVLSHFENVARGVIDLRDVLYFLSTGALFLVLAIVTVAQGRLSHGRQDYKRLRVGAGVAALLVLVINLLGGYIRGRVDLTAGSLYTLAEGTRDVMAGLDDIVQIKLFASEGLPPEYQLQLRDVRDLVSDLRRASRGNLVVTEIAPDGDEDAEQEAASYGIGPVEFSVLRDDELQIRRGYYGLAVIYADEQEVIRVIDRTDDLEYRLVSAIYAMTEEEDVQVGFVDGYGAKAPEQIPGLQEVLTDRYHLETVTLARDSVSTDASPPSTISPDSLSVLVVAGPTLPMDTAAVDQLRAFVDSGGSALLLLEAAELDTQSGMAIPVRSGLEPFLEEHGLRFSTNLVIDLASSERVQMGRGLLPVIAPYPLWPIARPASDHPVVRGTGAISLGWAGTLEVTDSARIVPLWQTSEAGGLHAAGGAIFPDQDWSRPPDELAVRTLAVAVDPGVDAEGGRMVVVSDGTFVEREIVAFNPSNIVFVANAIDWLAQDEILMTIRSKNRAPPTLVFDSEFVQNVLKWGNQIGVPLIFVLFGFARVAGRRRRAEARWKEVVP